MARRRQDDGWISLNRKLMSDPMLWLSEPFSRGQAWIDLLLLAQWRDRGIYKAGTVYCSMLFFADRWKWSRGRVKRFLDKLESEGRIRTETTKDGTTVLIENWGKYQYVCATGPENGTTKRALNDTTDGTTVLSRNTGKIKTGRATDDTTNDTPKRTHHNNIYKEKRVNADSALSADAVPNGWKTDDPRVPIEYRCDFGSYEDYYNWRNQ